MGARYYGPHPEPVPQMDLKSEKVPSRQGGAPYVTAVATELTPDVLVNPCVCG